VVRTLMCLPLCLLLAPSYPAAGIAPGSRPTQRMQEDDGFAKNGLPHPQKDIIGFLDACLKRYRETVQGYTLNFRKRERTLGKLHPWETIEAAYREQPHSAFFDWQEGARKALKALYVEGENFSKKTGKSQILALPAPPFTAVGIMPTDTDSTDSKRSGRYALNQFGLKEATQRTLEAWKAADARKALHVEYLGLHKVPEADGCICHKIRRHSYPEPEGDDGVTEVIIFIDRETLFQVATIVNGKDGELLGEYYFRGIRLNPEFAPGQFTTNALKK
jgi:hypothetical protein